MTSPRGDLGATLSFDGVSKWYGQVSAVSEVSFTVASGVTGLVGQNGAGKSSLLKLAAGVLVPSLGEVLIGGESPRSTLTRRRIGYCPDLERLYESLSGWEFVTWMLRLGGYPAGEARRRAADMLEELGLADAMHRKIRGYSKGMRQRVKLAQALAHEPRLVLLDEPLNGLDPVARHEIGQLIVRLGQQGVAVLVSSHVLHELENVAERFVLVHQGRLLAEGGLAELREQLADRPRVISVKSQDARVLAARLCEFDAVEGIRITGDTVRLEVTRGGEMFGHLTELGADPRGLVLEIEGLDSDLESVFGYLVAPR